MTNKVVTKVVVIGSGVAGSLIASRLVKSGFKVTILEAGDFVDRQQAVQNYWAANIKVPECAYPVVPEATFPTTDNIQAWYQQNGPDIFKSTYLKVVGGTTWHWLGTCLRLLPSDFQTKTLYGYGVDWPISYADLEPFYLEAEHELAVAGNSNIDIGSPRSGPYLLPEIPQTYLDKVFTANLNNTIYQVIPTPQARNSVMHDQRPACCGSSSCIPVCPVQAKYDATVHLKKAQQAGAELIDRCTVTRLIANENGLVQTAKYQRWDRSHGEIDADIFILACHAIETPRLLLASKNDKYKQGLANSSDQVGRNLMDHPVQMSWALSKDPVYPYRGPLSTSGIENLRDGDFRATRSAFRIEIGNDGWNWPTGAPISLAADMAKKQLSTEQLDQAISWESARHIRLAALTEQQPSPSNKVGLSNDKKDYYGVPLPTIDYEIGSYVQEGMASARQAHDKIFSYMSATISHHAENYFGAGHIMGTCRMGADPKQSVVDKNMCSHDHKNLYILGSAVFPTGGTANPTLTIAALSLKAAKSIIDAQI